MSIQATYKFPRGRDHFAKDFLRPIPSLRNIEKLVTAFRIQLEQQFSNTNPFKKALVVKEFEGIAILAEPLLLAGKRELEISPGLNRKRTKRVRVDTNANRTIARKLENGLEDHIGTVLLDRTVRDAIGDHAYRRVQLFYYLAAAYYKMGCQVFQGRTLLQHGKSQYEWSSAAHSSLLTNVTDNFEEVLRERLQKEGWGQDTGIILIALGVTAEKINRFRENGNVNELLEDIDLAGGIFTRECDFYNNMNSTVELPHIANEVDCVIERTMRPVAVEILNRVSLEGLHPYEAVKELATKMRVYMDQIEKNMQKQLAVIEKVECLIANIWDIEQRFSRKKVGIFLRVLREFGECRTKLRNLKKHSISVKVGMELTWQKKYINRLKRDVKKLIEAIKEDIKYNPPWQPYSNVQSIERIENALEIIRIQKKYTVVPEYTLLSGKLENGKRIPMKERDLFNQKLHIIKRNKPRKRS